MNTLLMKVLVRVLAVVACTAAVALAGNSTHDTLLVAGGPSPCLAVRVNVIYDSKRLAELNLGAAGTLKVQKGAPVHFEKGKNYLLQATCISTSAFTQSTGLTFVADGRTVTVQFAENGFQFRRGSVAY